MAETTGPSTGTVAEDEVEGLVWKARDDDAEGLTLVYTTFPTLELAKDVARQLVERKLAACVNIIPGMIAIFAWEGLVHEDGEVLVLIKTGSSLTARCIAAIKAGHPYTNPAALAFGATAGSKPYVDWIMAGTVVAGAE